MPIKFSGTKEDLPNIPDQTIQGEKTFLSTIIGDISSNNTSYFTDIFVNQISDIAGQVLTIDCSLNVKGNISYKDAGGSQQDLLAIIADLSGKIYDLSAQVDSGGNVDFSMTLINSAVNINSGITPNSISCEDISCNELYMSNGSSQLRVGTATATASRINTTPNNGSHFIKYTSGYQGYLKNEGVCIYGTTNTSSSSAANSSYLWRSLANNNGVWRRYKYLVYDDD